MKISNLALAGALAVAIPAIAFAATKGEVIKGRQANYKKVGGAFKALNDELKKDAPSLAVLRTNANNLNAAAIAVGKGFPKGTGAEVGLKTAALPAIWAQPKEFKAAMSKFQKAAATLKSAAAGGDIAKIKVATGGLGPNCKGCHDVFKAKN
jgi:cytochrome c556